MNKRVLFIIGIIVVGVIIYLCYVRVKSTVDIDNFKPSIYYSVTDEKGQTSIVHDSGVDPYTLPIILRISKIEYNEGIKKELYGIKTIKYGATPFNLDKVITDPDIIEDKDNLYIVKI